jgi:hypothetical protein
MRRGSLGHAGDAPFPTPRMETGRADFQHPAPSQLGSAARVARQSRCDKLGARIQPIRHGIALSQQQLSHLGSAIASVDSAAPKQLHTLNWKLASYALPQHSLSARHRNIDKKLAPHHE